MFVILAVFFLQRAVYLGHSLQTLKRPWFYLIVCVTVCGYYCLANSICLTLTAGSQWLASSSYPESVCTKRFLEYFYHAFLSNKKDDMQDKKSSKICNFLFMFEKFTTTRFFQTYFALSNFFHLWISNLIMS